MVCFPNSPLKKHESIRKSKIIYSHHNMQANFLFHGSDYLETSRAWIMHLSCVIPSTGLHEFDWAQVTWINPLSTSLNFFAWALMTGLMGTWIRFEYASSFPSSWRGFALKSSSTSKGLNSETLKVAITLYSLGKSCLYALSLICSRTWKGPSSGSKTSLCHPLLACSMLNFILSCICLTISTFFLPSKLTCSETSNGVKSNGIKELKL